jgi:hypothetical protein
MDDALVVCRLEGAGNLERNVERVAERHRSGVDARASGWPSANCITRNEIGCAPPSGVASSRP